MNFTFDTATETGEPVTLVFKPYGDAPGRISRHNINNIEAQVWGYLEWGLESPKFWPHDTLIPGVAVFDFIPQRAITTCYNEWQSSDQGS
jgi:hypothetical protein